MDSKEINLEIINEDFKKYYDIEEKKIGEGGFSIVYSAKNKKNGTKRAIKFFDKEKIRNNYMQEKFSEIQIEEMNSLIEDLINDIKNMKMLEKEGINNVPKIYECYDTNEGFVLVLELCDDNLIKVLAKRKEKYSPEDIREFLDQLNNCFKLMLKKNLFHKNIKLENILVNKENNKYIYKLTDFGLNNRLMTISVKLATRIRTLKFNAPEILKGESYNNKSDLWSLGVLIYILSFKEYPTTGQNEILLLKQISQIQLKKTGNEDLDDLLKKLLKEDPSKRISWEEYFEHPFFNNKKNISYLDIYELGEKIGDGAFADVFKAINKNTKEERAIKIMKMDRISSQYVSTFFREMDDNEMNNYINDFINEVEQMKLVEGKDKNNKNTVKLYEHFITEKEMVIVMELCDTNLTKYLANKKGPFNAKEIYNLLKQLNNTFKIMVENRISHRDLKLDNILIKYENKKPIAKLADYGVSKKLVTLSKNYSTKTGTTGFMAPEILKGEEYNEECDLWSLGILIYILSFKCYPYKGVNEIAILNQIKNNGHKILKKTLNNDLDDLIRQLLNEDPKKRIKWKDYFIHPFFNK